MSWSESNVADFVEETNETVQFLVCRTNAAIGRIGLTELDMQASNAELGGS